MYFNQRKVTSAARHQHGGRLANTHGRETQLTFQASSFSVALHFTKQLACGVLAVLGCIVVQCLILAFILLSKAQIRFVLLQAQMLRQLYGLSIDSEKRPSAADKKATKKATAPDGKSHLHIGVDSY